MTRQRAGFARITLLLMCLAVIGNVDARNTGCGGLPAKPTPAAPLSLPGQVSQGCAVFGWTMPGHRLRVEQRTVRVAADGHFVFGVARDQHGPVQVFLQADGQPERAFVLQVIARSWPTERVTGVPQATVTPTPAVAERIAREQAAVAATRQRDDPRDDFSQGFVWPVRGRISGEFGSQRIYNGLAGAPHSGVDVAAAAGTPTHAPAAGVVVFANPDLYLTGGTLLIDHGHGLTSAFLHMSRIDVPLGSRVEQGQVLGAVGATGRASGPHLHWGLNWFDVRLDPAGLPGIASP